MSEKMVDLGIYKLKIEKLFNGVLMEIMDDSKHVLAEIRIQRFPSEPTRVYMCVKGAEIVVPSPIAPNMVELYNTLLNDPGKGIEMVNDLIVSGLATATNIVNKTMHVLGEMVNEQ